MSGVVWLAWPVKNIGQTGPNGGAEGWAHSRASCLAALVWAGWVSG